MKRGTPRHKKMHRLAEALGVKLYSAVGIMEMLWHYAGVQTPEGDIGSVPDTEIAYACSWDKKPSQLIESMVFSGWLERHDKYRLVIHDWPEHCEQAVRKWLDRNGKDFLPCYLQKSGVCPDTIRTTNGHDPDFVAPSREVKARLGFLENKEEKKDEFGFEIFWSQFWRKTAKQQARKSWDRVVHDKLTATAVFEGLKLHSPYYLHREEQFRPHASTWLNQRRFEEPAPKWEEPLTRSERIMASI